MESTVGCSQEVGCGRQQQGGQRSKAAAWGKVTGRTVASEGSGACWSALHSEWGGRGSLMSVVGMGVRESAWTVLSFWRESLGGFTETAEVGGRTGWRVWPRMRRQSWGRSRKQGSEGGVRE